MIWNFTQHTLTVEQKAAGVCDPPDEIREVVKQLLTFEELPRDGEMPSRANEIARLAADNDYERVMIGGAPYFMAPLERALRQAGVVPLHAFTLRRAVDIHQSDGSVKKEQRFVHAGFIEACAG